jgi:hypothetical protein
LIVGDRACHHVLPDCRVKADPHSLITVGEYETDENPVFILWMLFVVFGAKVDLTLAQPCPEDRPVDTRTLRPKPQG